jgi:DNA-binding Lrp family transcriptional regulator
LVNSILLISHKPGILETLALKLLKLEGVYSVESLIGTFDFLVKIKTNSIKGLYYLKNIGIKNIEGIEDVKVLFIDKIFK